MFDFGWKINAILALAVPVIGAAMNSGNQNSGIKVAAESATISESEWAFGDLQVIPAPEPDKATTDESEHPLVEEAIRGISDFINATSEKADENENRVNQLTQSTCECTCDCDCPSIDEIREVVREELASALKEKMLTSASSLQSNNSSGGSVSTPVASGNSSGGVAGVTASSSGYYEPAAPLTSTSKNTGPLRTAIQNIAERRAVASNETYLGKSIVMHSFASGQYCSACENWWSSQAQRYRNMGYTVTRDKTARGSAPQFTVCNGDICYRNIGPGNLSGVAR